MFPVLFDGVNKKLEENFQDGVNTIVSAVNTKAGSSLTGANTPTEIAEVITGLSSGPYSVKMYYEGAGTAKVQVDIDGVRVITYSQPSGTAYGGHTVTGKFTPTD